MGHNGLLKTARPGQIVAELGSHASEVKERQVGRFLDKGVTFLDGEVSGTPGMLAARKAPIYLAGDEAACNKVAAVVKVFAEIICIVEPSAAGTHQIRQQSLVTSEHGGD
jgi:3-hydroxyisobutyrate dehydrogenase-like beta-hydroxyacid dehydrogenase